MVSGKQFLISEKFHILTCRIIVSVKYCIVWKSSTVFWSSYHFCKSSQNAFICIMRSCRQALEHVFHVNTKEERLILW